MTDDRPKLTRGLVQALSRLQDADRPLPVIVEFGSQRRVLRGADRVQGLQRGRRYRLRPFEQMYATPGAILRLEQEPDVVRIFQDAPVHAFLDVAVPHIEVPLVWEEGYSGAGVRIAVLDTGIDTEHPDFEGRIECTTDLTGEGVRDLNGHGTHCASSAAGTGVASSGTYRGAAPAATLHIAKVLDAGGNGMMSDVMAGVEWAVEQEVHVISLSLGSSGPCDGTDALSAICDAAVEQGVVVCVAAGNDGPGPYTIGSPGCARDVITIGAVSDQDRVASFSSRGPTRDGRAKPDVLLPGVGIVAARAGGTSMGSSVDEHYTSASGTSMATPQAAGVCALLLEAEPDLTPDQIKARLMETAVDTGADLYAQGSGRVSAWRALQAETTPQEPQLPTPVPDPAPAAGCLAALLNLWPRRRA